MKVNHNSRESIEHDSFSYLLFAAELIVIDPESLFLIGSDAISKVAEAIIFIAESVPKSIFSRCASMS